MPPGMATSNGPTAPHDRLNNSDNMGQRHYAKMKENMLLVKSSILIPNPEANTLHHMAILKNTVTLSYIYVFKKQALQAHFNTPIPNLENNILYHIRSVKKIAMIYIHVEKLSIT
jgi:hypothetical protein